MKNIRLLIIVLNSSYGGTEKHVIDIVRNIDKSSFELNIVVPNESSISTRLKSISGINVFEMERGLSCIFKIKTIIKRIEPDIVHLHSPRATFLGGVASFLVGKRNFKLISTAHGWIPDRLKLKRLYQFLYINLIKYNDKVIAVSNKVREQMISTGVNKDNIVVIYNGIPITSERSFSINRNNPKKFIFLGRFIEEKGLVYLIEAIRYLNNSYKDKYIVDLYGDGPLLDYIRSLINSYNLQNVNLKGFLDPKNIFGILNEYDSFLMPSIQEGFPYTLIEGFSAGLIVIASEVGGIPEALKDGMNGYLIKSKNSVDLANKMEAVINLTPDKYVELRKNSFQSSKKYSIENMIQSIDNQYTELIGNRI